MNKIVIYTIMVAAIIAHVRPSPADDPAKKPEDAAKAAADEAAKAAKDAVATTPAVPTTPALPTAPPTPPPVAKPKAPGFMSGAQNIFQDSVKLFSDVITFPLTWF